MAVRNGWPILVALTFVMAAPQPSPAGQKAPRAFARSLQWIEAARTHRPGSVDQPLVEVAEWDATAFESVVRHLKGALAWMYDDPAHRNEVLRRGILLHTDIALLTPDRAANFTRMPQPQPRSGLARERSVPAPTNSVVIGLDGQYLGSLALTAHWEFARALADAIHPSPSEDEFVLKWYRATIAGFEARYALGYASPHLERALRVFPEDPWILFYKGAMHEALAAPRYQNIARSKPPLRGQPGPLDSPRQELGRAEDYYAKAVQADSSFAEAHLRLGRVLGLRGRHAEALDELQRGLALTQDTVLRYFGDVFTAAEFEAIGRNAEARQAYETAAALFPFAEAPLVGLSELARRTGDRAGAFLAMDRLAALPARSETQIDPWWVYLRSYAWDADKQLEEVRRPFVHGESR